MKKKSPRRERKMVALPYRVWRDLNRVRAHLQKIADAECERYGALCVNLSLADAVEQLCCAYRVEEVKSVEVKEKKNGA